MNVKQHLSRRAFVAGAASAAATIAIVQPGAVRGAEANSKVEIGVIGLGGRGRWIAGLFAQHGGYKVSAVADYFPHVAAAAGDGLGVDKARRFSGLLGYRRLIDSKVDAVVLETPPWVFPEHAKAALDAGCHVYMAKPVACDVPGCLTIAELGKRATQAKKVMLVDFQIRTEPLWQECVQRAHRGALGKIALIASHYFDEGWNDPPLTKDISSRLTGLIWVNDVALGGGLLVNAGIHAIDAALWILGDKPPTSATGCSRRARKNPHGDSHDVFSLTYEFADGAILNHVGEHVQNNNAEPFCGCFVYGQGAYMQGEYNGGKIWIRGGSQGYRGGTVTNLYEEGAKRNIALFHTNVTKGICDNPTVPTSVNSTLACILGREAALAGGKVTWDEMIRAARRLEVDVTGLTP
ncbi:MAG: Gfo/Idh/MocA family oxidoreductase [Thermoguttaceae bacterium]|jgi:predicted dehydrogenase|nr:Gfo/Idh/MocA family oxidoreductase [Thermoguttaceae bacterium]